MKGASQHLDAGDSTGASLLRDKPSSKPFKAGENPFRTERLERVRFRLPDEATWEGLLSRLQNLRFRAAISGPHGSGKTTFLEQLAPRLEAQGFRLRHAKLDEETRALSRNTERELFSRVGQRDLIVLDGAEQLNPIRWLFFRCRARHAAGLLISLHRAGRLPTLIALRPTVGLLEELMRELSPEAVRTRGLDPSTLFAQHAGNLRLALLACYDICAGRGDATLPCHRA